MEPSKDTVVVEYQWSPRAGLTINRTQTVPLASLQQWHRGEINSESLVQDPGGDGRVTIVSASLKSDGTVLYANYDGWLGAEQDDARGE